jgi:hypothetical protein
MFIDNGRLHNWASSVDTVSDRKNCSANFHVDVSEFAVDGAHLNTNFQ